jgi:hypothetical protein
MTRPNEDVTEIIRLTEERDRLKKALEAIIDDSRHADGQPLYRYAERLYAFGLAALMKEAA